MVSRRTLMCLFLSGAVSFLTACPDGKKGRDRGTRIGRTGRGPVTYDQNRFPRPYQSTSGGTAWGEVIADTYEQYFQDELFYFTQPQLQGAPAGDQLGYVSGRSSQSTGVAFWGEVVLAGAGGHGQVDPTYSRIHIEIYDDLYGVARSNGTPREQIVIHIGRDQEGFVGAYGQMSGGQANIVLEDRMGTVRLQGAISGNQFTGTMYYANQYSGGERRLGRFSVVASGFFR